MMSSITHDIARRATYFVFVAYLTSQFCLSPLVTRHLMARIYAELQVAGRCCEVLHSEHGLYEPIDQIGRPNSTVHVNRIKVWLAGPHSVLPWATDQATRLRALTKAPEPLPSPELRAIVSNTRTTAEKKSVGADVQEGGPININNEEIFSPSAQDKVPASIKKFEASICQEPIENGRFYNHVGIPVTEVIKGGEAGIDLREYVGKVSGTIFTHNHPKSGFLSAADIQFAIQNNLKEIRAVTPEGVTISFERTGDNWGENSELTIEQAKISFKERYYEVYRIAKQQQNQKQIAEYNEVLVREMITAVAANNVAILKIFK
jgi:hypothetical protein